MDQLSVILAPLLSAYIGDFGWAVQVVSVVGTLRLFFKPIMAGIETAVKASESNSDDIILGKVQGNSIYKGFIFLIDLLSSVKVKPKQ
jgi:hypothetical protein